jgi:hypothetical protein
MRRTISTLATLLALTTPALADTVNTSMLPFPLTNDQLFPTRSGRVSLKCSNPPNNANATVTYSTGLVLVLVPGAALWEVNRPPLGQVKATGAAGQILACEEIYR